MPSLFIQIMIAIILKTNFRPLEIQFQGKRKVYFPKKFMGTSRGARTLCPAIVDGKQQRVALLVDQAFTNGMNAHIAP
ncbi:hypothetical protein VW41_12395 [Klebsiella michiganensis]|nr:hypothetical protein VW41_12395 [Klebsiella michiganensis]